VFEIHPNFTVPGLGHVCAGDVAVATARGGEWLTKFPRGWWSLNSEPTVWRPGAHSRRLIDSACSGTRSSRSPTRWR